MASALSMSDPITYPGPPPGAADVVVIGGGIVGVCTALFLARAGQKVVLCEKGRIAGEQSSRNWGWIRQQGRDPDELPIMAEAARHWLDFSKETNADMGVRQVGISYLGRSDRDMEGYRDWLDHAKAHGIDTKVLSRREVASLIPGAGRSFSGALHTASDMRAEPGVAVPALAGMAHRDGAILVENCAVRCLETTGNEVSSVVTEAGEIATSRVVVAGGAWSALFLRAHGVSIPQLSVAASVCATEPLPDVGGGAGAAGTVAWVRRDDGGYTLAYPGYNEFFLGPDAIRAVPKFWEHLKSNPTSVRYRSVAPRNYPDHWMTKRRWNADEVSPFEKMRMLDPQPNLRVLEQAARTFGELFPQLGPVRIAQTWGGMIDTMPDFVPVIGPAPSLRGVVIGTGMSGHGFGIGPGVGRVLADLAMGRDPGHDLARFRATRYSDGSQLKLGPS